MATQTIEQFVSANSRVKPGSDIVERWESRIVANAMHLRGANGASSYIGAYGKGISVKKVVAFARCAELKGFPEMAAGFWSHAFFMETGIRASVTANGAVSEEPAFPSPALKQSFRQRPQLLVAIDSTELDRYIADDRFGAQEKVDGERVLVSVTNGVTSAGNKKGLERPAPMLIGDRLAAVRDALFDGEDVDGVFHVFDLLELHGVDMRGFTFETRHSGLLDVLLDAGLGAASDNVRAVRLVTGKEKKRAFVAEMRARGAEGVVFKNLGAVYEEGDAHGTQFKYQFRGLAAVVVGEPNGAKHSVEVFVRSGATTTMRSLGFVTLPPSQSIPAPGTIIEVEYLYLHKGAKGKLAQPVFKCTRTDVDPADCTDLKLRVKDQAENEG
jgi:hypothetical protein